MLTLVSWSFQDLKIIVHRLRSHNLQRGDWYELKLRQYELS